MPNAMMLLLERENNAPLPRAVGECTHAAFFELLVQADPELAAELHANAERKPFTLTEVREGWNEQGETDGSAGLRITFLDDSLFPRFAGALLHGTLKTGFRIGDAQFALTGLFTMANAHPQAGQTTYAQLHAQARDEETIAVYFESPTCFKSQKKDVLSPTPRHVWQSWVRAWNAYTLPEMRLDETRVLALAERQVNMECAQLETHDVTSFGGGLKGFTGACIFDMGSLPTADRRIFALLADFAFYAGTGRKTTMGLGQTYRLMPPR